MRRILRIFFLIIGALALAFGISWVIYMPNSEERGVWKSDVGGMVLDLSATRATVYGQTSAFCLEDISFPAHMKLVEILEGARIKMVDAQLHLTVEGVLEPFIFSRIDALPDECGKADPATATPRDVFDATWTAMNEHYAFFDLHGVDWDARKALAPDPDATLTDEELANLLLQMMDGINDGHVRFYGEAIGYRSPKQRPAWIPEGNSLNRSILREIATANTGTALISAEEAPIRYGLRSDGVGYIAVQNMDVVQAWGQGMEDAMAAQFNDILTTLSDAKALIIDVRYNPGGSDPVSFGIASHFTDAQMPVFTKSSRIGDGQSESVTATISPFDNTPVSKPTIVLTSKLTGSAAEIFTMAMREMPQVTVMGEATSGGLSDVLSFTLPNGWGLGLSNQTYLTMDGTLFEGIGVQPDIPLEFETAQFLAGRDPILTAAIAKANELAN